MASNTELVENTPKLECYEDQFKGKGNNQETLSDGTEQNIGEIASVESQTLVTPELQEEDRTSESEYFLENLQARKKAWWNCYRNKTQKSKHETKILLFA